jgi:hypothetical protein
MNNTRENSNRRDLMLSTGITEILLTSALLVSTLKNVRYPLQLNKKFEPEYYNLPPTYYAF